jgi:thioredoxin 1
MPVCPIPLSKWDIISIPRHTAVRKNPIAPLNMSWIFDVSEADFERRVLAASRGRAVLVDFWADWCPPCRALTPVLERLAGEYRGAFLLAKVEADENMRLAGRYQLRGFPTVLLVSGGEVVDRFSGFRPPEAVRAWLDPWLKPGGADHADAAGGSASN